MKFIWFALAVLGVLVGSAHAQAPLTLEAKIPLGEVKGRIDHLAIDLGRHRLFVAELGNRASDVCVQIPPAAAEELDVQPGGLKLKVLGEERALADIGARDGLDLPADGARIDPQPWYRRSP